MGMTGFVGPKVFGFLKRGRVAIPCHCTMRPRSSPKQLSANRLDSFLEINHASRQFHDLLAGLIHVSYDSLNQHAQRKHLVKAAKP